MMKEEIPSRTYIALEESMQKIEKKMDRLAVDVRDIELKLISIKTLLDAKIFPQEIQRNQNEYGSIADYCKVFKVSKRTVYHWIKKNKITHFKTPSGRLRLLLTTTVNPGKN